MNYNKQSEQGFTLIELMIALLLGLIITAAVAQIYVTSIRTSTTQRAAAGILDANVYGLQHMENSLRMAGLGLSDSARLGTACSGILVANPTIVTTQDVMKCMLDKGAVDVPVVTTGYHIWSQAGDLPIGGYSPATPNTNNTAMPQLTVQYRAPVHMRDCEGRMALGPRRATVVDMATSTTEEKDIDGQVIIERYFATRNSEGVLELYCDAGRYSIEVVVGESSEITSNPELNAAVLGLAGVSELADFDSNDPDGPALVISGIDDFQIQFGVRTPTGIIYQSIRDYMLDPNSANDSTEIVAVKMGILAKGIVAAPEQDMPTNNPSYIILGRTVQMNGDQPTNFIRRVYETNTMLRNARGSS